MKTPANRDDLSRFLVHLTREYDDKTAQENLIKILKEKTIEARNAHCLVMHRIRALRLSKLLKAKFQTVCFTETPLTQIKHICKDVKGRQIHLQPYGLIFWKDSLFEVGASPAVYINAKGTSISTYLLKEFDSIFKKVKTFRTLKKQEKEHYSNIVHYYSLINIINDRHDFHWEREWRHHGNFKFKYKDIVAIIAENPDSFDRLCKTRLSKSQYKWIEKLPIINPSWTYEELLEELAIRVWDKLS